MDKFVMLPNKNVYRGQLTNNLPNGLGKEYAGSKIKFDGEWRNGKYWNGFSYDCQDQSFQGEWRSGRPWEGEGAVYAENSNKLKYRGPYKNGFRHG
jgi:hypothetical protein